MTSFSNIFCSSGRTTFSSVHIIAPESMAESPAITNMIARGNETHVHTHTYTISEDVIASSEPMREYTQIFEIASALIENRADRASLLVFVGSENVAADAYAVFIGMLPFRGAKIYITTFFKNCLCLVDRHYRCFTQPTQGLRWPHPLQDSIWRV